MSISGGMGCRAMSMDTFYTDPVLGQIRHQAGQNVLSTCVEPDKIYTLKCCLSYN